MEKSNSGLISFLIMPLILSVLFFPLVSADSTAATWTRAYCLYNAGSGGYACDSGQAGGNTASCNAANGVQCAQEGDVYCYAQSYCEVAGTTNQGPVNAYNVNWDSDSADCSCKVGSGRFGIRFISGTQSQCCGDDASEYYIAASNPKNIDKIDTCCKADAYVFNAICCGDDASEFYAGPSTGKSCDGTQACCSSPSQYVLSGNCVSACPSVSSVYFSDLAGNKITQADISDYVMMVAETAGAEGMLVNFTVFEAGASSCYSENYSAYSSSNKASVLWKVKACGDGSSDGNKFKAFVSTMPSLYKESELLSVSLAENDSLPVALISQPKEASMFNVNENINFVSGSYDLDDPITSYLWNFGDGGTSSIANTTHAYSSGGPKTITLTVQNIRGKTASIMIGILINSSADDPPLAIISQPAYGEKFSGMLITFNATKSIDDVKPFSQLIFTWEFDDGSTYSEKGMNGAYFTKLFSVAGEHNVKLTVDDSDPVSQTETIFYIKGCQVPLDGGYEFVPLGSCSSVSKHYFCTDNESIYYDTMNEHCEGADGIALTADDCCPRGFYCPNVAVACTERPNECGSYNASVDCQLYGCIWLNGTCSDPANMISCSDYQNEEACSGDVIGLGRAVGRGLGTDICGKVFGDYVIPQESCMCKWDSASGTCQLSYNVNKTIGGEGFITCIKSFSLTGCVAGTQTMNWIAKCSDWNGGVDCAKPDAQIQCSSGSKQVKCGTIVSKMPFFNLFNLILAIAILGIYYAFMISKQARHHKSKA